MNADCQDDGHVWEMHASKWLCTFCGIERSMTAPPPRPAQDGAPRTYLEDLLRRARERVARMSPEDLYAGFKWAYRETFRMQHVLRRAAKPCFNAIINLLGSLAYRVFVHRLYTEPRYALPYSVHNPGALPAEGDWADAFLLRWRAPRVAAEAVTP